ncbi:hypothetical protein Esti_002123 [Eimeria stiedai]
MATCQEGGSQPKYRALSSAGARNFRTSTMVQRLVSLANRCCASSEARGVAASSFLPQDLPTVRVKSLRLRSLSKHLGHARLAYLRLVLTVCYLEQARWRCPTSPQKQRRNPEGEGALPRRAPRGALLRARLLDRRADSSLVATLVPSLRDSPTIESLSAATPEHAEQLAPAAFGQPRTMGNMEFKDGGKLFPVDCMRLVSGDGREQRENIKALQLSRGSRGTPPRRRISGKAREEAQASPLHRNLTVPCWPVDKEEKSPEFVAQTLDVPP